MASTPSLPVGLSRAVSTRRAVSTHSVDVWCCVSRALCLCFCPLNTSLSLFSLSAVVGHRAGEDGGGVGGDVFMGARACQPPASDRTEPGGSLGKVCQTPHTPSPLKLKPLCSHLTRCIQLGVDFTLSLTEHKQHIQDWL